MGRIGKKPQYGAICKFMFAEQFMEFIAIAKVVPVSERQIREWAKEDDWMKDRHENMAKRTTLNRELYDFALELTASLRSTISAGENPQQSQVYLLTGLLNRLDRVKDYEDQILGLDKDGAEDGPKEKESLTEEDVQDIRSRILG